MTPAWKYWNCKPLTAEQRREIEYKPKSEVKEVMEKTLKKSLI